ncbi:hypothetical protein ACFL2O_01430 [Thermodesulfobacteriota bacterium]
MFGRINGRGDKTCRLDHKNRMAEVLIHGPYITEFFCLIDMISGGKIDVIEIQEQCGEYYQ